jgi:hypothetical protein
MPQKEDLMKIAVFDVESWEREAFKNFADERDIRFTFAQGRPTNAVVSP